MSEPPAPHVGSGAAVPSRPESLPWMGLGLSTNLSSRGRPRPWRLLERAPGAFDYVEYSAPLDPERARREAPLFETLLERLPEVPALFHPVHLNLYGPALEEPAALEALQRHLRVVGAPWVSNDVGWWHAAGRFFPGFLYLPPPLSRAGVEDCAAHVAHVQAATDRPLAVENPALIAVRGDMHVLDFMAALHARTGAPLLLDLGHLLSHQLARGLPAEAGLEGFPLEAVIEIHVAGGVVSRRGARAVYVDDHPQPVREELFELLEAVAPRCPGLRALTYEADGHPDALARATLARLRGLLPLPARREEAPAPRADPEARVRRPDAEAPWRLFEETFAGAEPAEDAEGLRAERDVRLAVLAQHLDRVFPLTRLLLAPGREGLAAFSASPEFRAGFEAPGRDATESFARYVRRRLRAAPDEAAARALAFESWAAERAGARRAPPRTPAAGELALAPGVAYGEFPLDLAELLHAAGSLRRHLAGRAEVSGVHETGALDALRQVALRAPPGPWPVAVRARGESVEALALPPELAALLAAAARGGARAERADPGALRLARERRLVVVGVTSGSP